MADIGPVSKVMERVLVCIIVTLELDKKVREIGFLYVESVEHV